MKLRIIASFVLPFLLIGCATNVAPISKPSPTSKINPLIKTPTLPIKTTSTSTMVSTENSVISGPTPISATLEPLPTKLNMVQPVINKVCPENQEVVLQEIDLNQNYGLVLKKMGDDGGLVTISKSVPTINPIPNTSEKNGLKLYSYNSSPEKKWLVLRYAIKPISKTTSSSIWLSSADGTNQRHLITVNYDQEVLFVSEEEIIIVGFPEGRIKENPGTTNLGKEIPLKSVNLTSGNTLPLAPLPENALFLFYFTKDNHSYAVYKVPSGVDYEYFLHDYTNDETTPVFQWMENIEGWHYLSPGIGRIVNDSFATVVDRAYGFDYAVGLSFDQIFETKTYLEMMEGIILPGGYDESLTTSIYYSIAEDFLPVTRSGSDLSKTSTILLFDHKEKTLRDYCLALYHPAISSISPDGRFLVIKNNEFVDDGAQQLKTKGVLILDSQSGKYSILDGYSDGQWVYQN